MRHYRIAQLAFAFVAFSSLPAAAYTATVTPLMENGPRSDKKNIVIIGDGFTASEQTTWADDVKDKILDGLFTEGPLWEDQNAFNIYRIDLQSAESGVSQVTLSTEALTPDVPPGGGQLAFTFSAVAHVPLVDGTKITDPNGRTIVEGDVRPDGLYDLKVESGAAIVTGTLDRATGVVTLTYTTGNAPPAGAFNMEYNGVSTARNSALGYYYAPHMWCYFRQAPDTEARVKEILLDLLPEYSYYTVVLNEDDGGGCTGSGMDVLTKGEVWTTYAHESGHLVGGLCDEYTVWDTDHGNFEPGCVNATINDGSTRSTLKWVDFMNPSTTCPNTPFVDGTDDPSELVGHFLGADYHTKKAWRPAYDGRMRGNAHPFGPVSYDHVKNVLDGYHEHDFAETYVGDFNGDGRSDIVIHKATALELYISDGTHTLPKWVRTLPLGNWDFADHDRFLVGDFDADGRDDLFAYNMVDFSVPRFALFRSEVTPGFTNVVEYHGSMPGWGVMRPGDKFYVADFDGDGKTDLYASNTGLVDWPIGYFGMVRSTGSALEAVTLYVDRLPGWDKMKPGDQFYVANVDGIGGKDLYVVNNTDWCSGYLLSLLSTGTGLAKGVRYDQVVPGWANLMPGDKYFVADFEGSGREGLYAFNGADWSTPYLGVMRSTGHGVVDVPILHQGYVAGWGDLKPNDQFMVGNVNGQGGTDLFGVNSADWPRKMIGRLIAYPDGFQGNLQADMVGKWTLASDDVFHVADFTGTAGGLHLDDLIVHRDTAGDEFLGLLRNNGNSLDGSVVYWKWIHHFPYHATGYW